MKTKKIKITVFSDPGHAWGRVNKALLSQLNIENQISLFSYEKGKWAYLEEDCDLPRLIKALESNGLDFQVLQKIGNTTSKIRSYERYNFI